jgi:hypothetical protein
MIFFQNSGAMIGDIFGSGYFSFNRTMDFSALFAIVIVIGYLVLTY